MATSSRDAETATRRGREPGSDRVEAVLLDNGGVEATGLDAVALPTGAVTKGSTLFVPAPDVAFVGEV